eukprot:1566504-Prymnesium_polylepis.1
MDSTEEKPNDIVTGSDPEGAAAEEAAAPPSTPAQLPSQVRSHGTPQCDHIEGTSEQSPISISSTASSATRLRRGEFSATDSEDSKASSTATTPKESSRKVHFNHEGNTPPGHYSGASWEAYERKKRP